jgi:SOS-response transcriptional repressor LexA
MLSGEAERYAYIQEKSGLSKKEFAESLGLVKSHGSIIASGRQKLSRQGMEKMKALYHVNLDWYLTGEGASGLDTDAVEIELIDQEAAAGRGREAEDYAERRAFSVPRSLIAPYRPEKLEAVYVTGDSMTSPDIGPSSIYSGDIAIFYPGLVRGDGIYVVSVGNELLVKRVVRDDSRGVVELLSANPAYPPRRFEGQALDDVRIAGMVVAVFHRV